MLADKVLSGGRAKFHRADFGWGGITSAPRHEGGARFK